MINPSKLLLSGLLIGTLLSTLLIAGCAQQAQTPTPTPAPSTTDTSNAPAAPAPAITEAKAATYGAKSAALKTSWTVEEILQYAIEDEYIARAEYKYVIAAFGAQNPFSNIVSAEETHINALIGLYNARHMTIPADNSGQHLIKPATVKDSLALGVEAEIANINMYKGFLNAPNLPDDVKTVFNQLKAGSESHLSAFENGLKRYQ